MSSPNTLPADYDPSAFGVPQPETQVAFETALQQLPIPQETTLHRKAGLDLPGSDDTRIRVTINSQYSQHPNPGETSETSTISLILTDSEGLPRSASSFPDSTRDSQAAQEIIDNQRFVTSGILEALDGQTGVAAEWVREACRGIEEPELFRHLAADQLLTNYPGTIQTWQTPTGTQRFRNGTTIEMRFTTPAGEPLVGPESFRLPSYIELREQDGMCYQYDIRQDGIVELAIIDPTSAMLPPPKPPRSAGTAERLSYVRKQRAALYNRRQASRQGVLNVTEDSLRQLTMAIEAALAEDVTSLEE